MTKWTWIPVAGGLLALGACASSPETTAPEGPTDVRITELSPEVLDQLADRVAERLKPAVVAGGTVLRRDPVRPVRVRPPRAPSVQVDPIPDVEPAPTEPLSRKRIDRLGRAVGDGLAWLAEQQSENGSWSAKELGGSTHYVPGITGLATLAFLEAGHTTESKDYGDTVKDGLRYLVSIQDPEGCLGPRVSQHFMYNHAAGSLALVEAYRRTGDERLKGAAQRAVNFIQMAQNPYLGWRYGVRDGDNDTSVTGWMTHVLARARGKLTVDAAAFTGARAWMDKMTEPEFGRIGYQQRGGPPARTMESMAAFPADRSEALTAIGLLARIETGADPRKDELAAKSAKLIEKSLPIWAPKAGTTDLYYWHWGTRALARVGGDGWLRWQNALADALLQGQTVRGSDRGSWPANGPWGSEGGRAYATSMAVLSLAAVLESNRSD